MKKYSVSDGTLVELSSKAPYEQITAYHCTSNLPDKIHENYSLVPQQQLLWNTVDDKGFCAKWRNSTITDVASRVHHNVDLLPPEAKRLSDPHPVPVWVTKEIAELRAAMIRERVLREDFLTE